MFTGKFINGSNQVKAVKFALSLDKRPLLVSCATHVMPWILDIPIVKEKTHELTKKRVAFLEPKLGQKPGITPKIYNLYLAVMLYHAQGDTWVDSYNNALDNYPEFVPDSWVDDPSNSLKKTVIKINRKYPALAKNIGWVDAP